MKKNEQFFFLVRDSQMHNKDSEKKFLFYFSKERFEI